MSRFQFHKFFLLAFFFMLLAGCSGGDGIDGTGTTDPEVSGTAAEGKAIANKTVTIKDRMGAKRSVTTDDQGKFRINVKDLTPPFILNVNTTEERRYFTIAPQSGIANLHPYSDVIARNWFGSRGRHIEQEFDDDTIGIVNPPLATELSALFTAIKNLLVAAFQQFNVQAQFDFIQNSFDTNSSGFDRLLDYTLIKIKDEKITIKLKDPETGFQATIILEFDLSDDLTDPDTQAPTFANNANATAFAASPTSVVLIWNSFTDNIGVAGYRIYRTDAPNQVHATTPFPVFSDTGLTADIEYCYQIEAFDGAENTSSKTTAVCATPLQAADVTPPAAATVLAAQASGASEINLTWTPPQDVDVLGYDIYRVNSGVENTKIATVVANSYNDIDLTASTNYCYIVKAFDAAGNRSADSVEICATTTAKPQPDTTAPLATASPLGGTYNTPQSVTLTCNDNGGSGCAAIYYAIDGSIPTTASSVYATAIGISSNTTLRFFAVDNAGNAQAIQSLTYTIDTTVPVTTANPAGGTFASTQSVTLTCSDGSGTGCLGIYYTVDGSEPTTQSPVYNQPLNITSNTTLRFFAIDAVGNEESPKRIESYVIGAGTDLTAPTNTTAGNFINSGATSTNSTSVILSLASADNVAVSAYFAATTTSATVPEAPAFNAVGWQSVSAAASYIGNVNYTLTGTPTNGDTLYVHVWFKDAAGNVSQAASDSVVYQPVVIQPLNLSIVLNPDRVRPNETLNTLIRVTNSGVTSVNNIVVQATYPATGVNAINQAYLSGGGTCSGSVCNPADLVTWNVGALAAGQGVLVSMPMDVAAAAVAGSTITLPVEVRVNGTQVVSGSKSVTVDTDNALSLALDENKDTVAPNETLVYTLTYGNRSTADVSSTTLSLPLPPGVTFVSASGGGSFVNNVVTWPLSLLQAGQVGRQQVNVTVNADVTSGTVLAIDAAQIAGTHATTSAELARATAATRVLSTPALGLTLEMDPDPVRPGEDLYAKLTVSNRSGDTLSGTILQARFPGDGIYNTTQAYLSGGGTCNSALANNSCDPSELVTWNLGTLEAGAAVTVTMPMSVYAAVYTSPGRLITLEAFVSADGAPSSAVSHTAAVDDTNALTLALDENKDAVAPNETLIYTLTYGNRSTASVSGTTLSLPLPVGVTFVSASGGGSLVNNVVTWSLSLLQAGQVGRQQVNVTVDADVASGTVLAIDAAQLAGFHAMTGDEQARATAATRVLSTPALGLTLEMDPDPVRPGEDLYAKLTVSNRSGSTLSGTILHARFPSDGVLNTAQAYLSGGGTCNSALANNSCDPYELVTWNLGTLNAGAAVTVTMPMSVNTAAYISPGRLITLEAFVSADGIPSSAVSHTAAVDNTNALTLALDENKDAVAPNETLIYTLTYGNRSSASVSGSTLTLPLPTGVTFVSASGGGLLVNNVVTWSLSLLQAGQVGRQQVNVTVNADVTSGTVLAIDAAELTGTHATTGAEMARATAATRVLSTSAFGLTLEMNPDPVRPGEDLYAKLTVSNRSGGTLFGTILQARFPSDGVSNIAQAYLSGGGTCNSALANNSCDPSELVIWNLGTLEAGAAVTVTMPMSVYAAAYTSPGRLITLEAFVSADGVPSSIVSHTVAIDDTNALTLALDEDKDALAPNDTLIYTLTYGNRSTASVSGSTLTLPLPTGVTFVSASGGGSLVNNVVTWPLSLLQAGQVGRQQVTVTVNAGVTSGTILAIDAAQLAGTHSTTGAELARATVATRVIPDNPITLSVLLTPNPVTLSGINAPSTLTGTIVVTNPTTLSLTGVVLLARFPGDGVNNTAQTLLTGGGTCNSAIANNACDPSEFVTWNLGTLGAGAAVTVTVPMTVFSATYFSPGELIVLDAEVKTDTGAQATAADTAVIGTGSF